MNNSTETARARVWGLFLVVAVLAAAAVVAGGRVQAQGPTSCPAGFELSANQQTCEQPSQAEAARCATGTLSPSGTFCYLPAQTSTSSTTETTAAVQTVTKSCPAGTTPVGGLTSLRIRS